MNFSLIDSFQFKQMLLLNKAYNKKRFLTHVDSSIKSLYRNKRFYCKGKNEINSTPFEAGTYSHAIQFCFEKVKFVYIFINI